MKAKNVLDKLKDLKLRRWGPAEYTEAKNSNEGDDGCSGGSTEIDYEAIYQFYKNKLIEATPQEFLESAIIPEHYAFIEIGHGPSSEYENKFGIWYSDSQVSDKTGKILFCETNSNFEIVKYIYLGNYNFIQPR